MVRRKLFVPKPNVWNLENFNSRLPGRCLELGRKPHHTKDEEEVCLFAEDRGALLPLPAKRFDVVTWRRMRTDKYGVWSRSTAGTAIPRTRPTRAVTCSSACVPSR